MLTGSLWRPQLNASTSGKHDFGVAKVTEIDYAAARALAEAEIHAPNRWGYPGDLDLADLVIVDDATLDLHSADRACIIPEFVG